MQRLRVLLLIKCLGFGGAERLVVSVAQARDRDCFDYEVAYVLATENALVPDIEAAGVPVHCLGPGGHYDLRWTVRLRRLLGQRPFDVVHLHLPYVAALGRVVARSLPAAVRPRLVYTEHAAWSRTPAPVRLLNRLTIGLDDADLAVSEAAKQAMPARLRPRVEVVVHGLPLSVVEDSVAAREEVRAELGISSDQVLIVTVANFRAQKAYDVLLESASQVLLTGLPVVFAAVGHGPLESEILAVHHRLGLGDRFRFLGYRADAMRVVAGADVFVLASHYEGFPVALMEAMAVGVPVVSTAVGAVPQALEDGIDGLIVPPGAPGLLATALTELAGDPMRRAAMAGAARQHGRQYDIDNAVRRIESVYREVVDRP